MAYFIWHHLYNVQNTITRLYYCPNIQTKSYSNYLKFFKVIAFGAREGMKYRRTSTSYAGFCNLFLTRFEGIVKIQQVYVELSLDHRFLRGKKYIFQPFKKQVCLKGVQADFRPTLCNVFSISVFIQFIFILTHFTWILLIKIQFFQLNIVVQLKLLYNRKLSFLAGLFVKKFAVWLKSMASALGSIKNKTAGPKWRCLC